MVGTEKGWRYYAAVGASTVSTVGWLVAFGTAVYLSYLVLIGEPSGKFASILILSFAAGIGFALLEKRLYRVD